MKSVLIFISANLIAVQCFATGAGSVNVVPNVSAEIKAAMQLPTVPPQVAGAIKGNVMPNTNVSIPPKAEIVDKRNPEKEVIVQVPKQKQVANVAEMKTTNFGKFRIPADYKQIKILGDGVVPREQALKYLQKSSSGMAKLNCSMKDIVDYYYEEAEKEGVRPDLAFCQAIVETGSFRFSGTVKPNQNNFCGLGTTGKGVHGAKFGTARDGVRAHIQHLLAYCQKEQPKNKIVDPRYDLAHRIRLSRGLITNWYGLNGTWAMGANYCEKIMAQYYAMLSLREIKD